MHIAFFSDQHPASLGGLQVSLGLQRQYLERAGHQVTVCAPDSRCRPSPEFSRSEDVVLNAIQFGEHAFCLASSLQDRAVDAAFAGLAPVDVVHVQADVWGAWLGHKFAKRHGLPIVHTMHTNIEVGLPAVAPFPRAAFRMLLAMQRHYLHTGTLHDISDYVAAFADSADEIIVPSNHFADQIRRYGVNHELHTVPTGVDDAQIDQVCALPRVPRSRPVLMWPGRVSEEKRLDEALRAFAHSEINADLHVYGSGPHLSHCEALTDTLGIRSKVHFHGAVAHSQVLRAMHQADVVLQSSLSYETQGLTVYESISVGTPVVVRDPHIVGELPSGWCHPVADDSIDAFASALSDIPEMLSAGPFSRRRAAPNDFRQSALTDRIIAVYEKAIAESQLPWWQQSWGSYAA